MRALLLMLVVWLSWQATTVADQMAADPITVAPRLDWTTDGQVLVTVTLIPNASLIPGALTHAELTVTGSEGVTAQSLPDGLQVSEQQLLMTHASSLTESPITRALGTLHGRQLTGLFAVPPDHPSILTLSVTADSPTGLITVSKTLTIDPQAIRGSVVVITPPSAEPTNAALPARSSLQWGDE